MKEKCLIRASACLWAGLILTLGLPMSGARAADGSPLPADERLAPVRASLEKTIEQARRDGLPTDMIVSKVREGLAKGIAPQEIRAAAELLAGSLAAADHFLRANRKSPPPPGLVRAMAEGKSAGLELEATAPLVASKVSDPVLVRALEVLADLAARGYPGRRAALLINDVAARDVAALGRVVAGVEEIRARQTVSRADALETLGRNIAAGGGSFDSAMSRALEDGERGNANPNGPGHSAQAPGHQGSSGAGNGKKPKK